MKHNTLYLNSKRIYLLVKHSTYGLTRESHDNNYIKVGVVGEDLTWYDSRTEFAYKKGDRFLDGTIEKVVTYEEYMAEYPDAKEMITDVDASTADRGYIRTTTSDKVQERPFEIWYNPRVGYAINPKEQSLLTNKDIVE